MTKGVKHKQNPWPVLLLVMTGVFLSTMDSGMVNVALPTIMRFFAVSLESAELVVTSYLLTITITLVFWGKLADRVGRGTIYLAGMSLFSFGALACYFSTTFFLLLVSRIFQALGASMMMSSGPAIIKTVFPKDHLGRSLGLVGIATACGLLTGPFVSGLLLAGSSWRNIFLITIPLSLVTILLGRFFLFERLKENQHNKKVSLHPFDWLGSFCWVAVIVVGIMVFYRLDNLVTLQGVLLVCSFALLLTLFITIERKAINPILPLLYFRKRYYWIAVVTAAISFAVLFSVLVLIPFYLEYILLLPVDRVGQLMMAVPATLIVLSPASGYLYDKIGARYLTTGGLALCGCALSGLVLLSPESSLLGITGKLALLGAGQSIFLSPNSSSVLSKVSDEYLGISSGILATARNFGMVIGATLAAALFSWCYSFYTGGEKLIEHAEVDSTGFILALRATFALVAGLAFIASFISAFRR